MELLKLARALQAHEKNFGLPVPKEILGDIVEARDAASRSMKTTHKASGGTICSDS